MECAKFFSLRESRQYINDINSMMSVKAVLMSTEK